MAGEQFHIYIHDGANTVAYGRDFLREQDAELNRAMTEFMQGCRDEKEAFEQSIDAIGNQCYNSSQLAEDAWNIVGKAERRVWQAKDCFSLMEATVGPAEGMVEKATTSLELAEDAICRLSRNIEYAKSNLKSAQDSIDTQNDYIRQAQDEIKRYQQDLKNASNQNSFECAQKNIEQKQEYIKSIKNHPSYCADSERISTLKNDITKFKEELAQAREAKNAAAAALAAARNHLAQCQQKVSEAEALKRQAEALEQKAKANQVDAEKAHSNDVDKYQELKKTAKDSARYLGELADKSLSIQRDASDNLCDNAAIMDKLSGLMYKYETYSLDRGKWYEIF